LSALTPAVPTTISDQQYADLSRNAVRANPQMCSDKAIEQRKASNAQRRNAAQS